jgi:hypothetical protein
MKNLLIELANIDPEIQDHHHEATTRVYQYGAPRYQSLKVIEPYRLFNPLKSLSK